MENGIARNIFNSYRGQSCNNTTFAWETRELHPSRFCWSNNNHSLDSYPYATTTAPATARVETDEFATHTQGSASPALVFSHHHGNGTTTTTTTTTTTNQYPLYLRNGSHLHPDPHLVCLRVGKQHHFEDCTSLSGNGFSIGKRGKLAYYNFGGDAVRPSSSRSAAVPRCQVEGCHVALVNVKEYHRRHKVCEKHSKAPNVVVLGLEQRFCQQCSRFHVVSEFDDSKRSCRRRLAGHNQRRRKSSHDSLSISRSCSQDNRNRMTGRFPYLPSPSTGCALSLLSSGADSWVSPSDLSSRSSAALRELIEENRASILASQLLLDRDWHLHLHHHSVEDLGEAQTSSSCVTGQQHHQLPEPHGWGRFPATGSNVTLDLMQASSSAVSMLSGKGEK